LRLKEMGLSGRKMACSGYAGPNVGVQIQGFWRSSVNSSQPKQVPSIFCMDKEVVAQRRACKELQNGLNRFLHLQLVQGAERLM
jgi:hypothetical protein